MKLSISVAFSALLLLSLGSCSDSSSATSSDVPSAKDHHSIDRNLSNADFQSMIDTESDEIVVDLRTTEERDKGTITPSVQVDFYADDFRSNILELDKSKPIMLFCARGRRSGIALDTLLANGYENAVHLANGYDGWKH